MMIRYAQGAIDSMRQAAEQVSRPARTDDGHCARCGSTPAEYHSAACSCDALGHQDVARHPFTDPGGTRACLWCGTTE